MDDFVKDCNIINYNQVEETIKALTVIIPNGPLHRIQIDLWEVPKKLTKLLAKHIRI